MLSLLLLRAAEIVGGVSETVFRHRNVRGRNCATGVASGVLMQGVYAVMPHLLAVDGYVARIMEWRALGV